MTIRDHVLKIAKISPPPTPKGALEDLITGDEDWVLYDYNTRHAIPARGRPTRTSQNRPLLKEMSSLLLLGIAT